jgi:hypothetical protein
MIRSFVTWDLNVTSKPANPPPATDKQAQRPSEKNRPTEEDLTRNAPTGKPEGRDNLRKRSEWFRRRVGGADE